MSRSRCIEALFAAIFLCIPSVHTEAEETATQKTALSIAVPKGYVQEGAAITGTLARGRATRVLLPIDAPGCFRIVASSLKNADDISLAIFQEAKEVARDRLSGKSPAVDWCDAKGGGVEAEILMLTGEGSYSVAVFRKKAVLPSVSSAKHTKAGGDDNDFIANRIRQLAPQFAKAQLPITEVLRGNVKESAELSIPVKLSGKCVTLVAAQAPSLLELAIYLENDEGRKNGRINATASYTTLVPENCPTKGEYRLIVRSIRGEGSFGVQIFSN